MRKLRVTVVAFAVHSTLLCASLCLGDEQVKRINLVTHVDEATPRSACRFAMPSNIRTEGGLAPNSHYVYLLLDAEASVGTMRAFAFKVKYDDEPGRGIDIHRWNSCDPHEMPTFGWPRSGTGNRIIWTDATHEAHHSTQNRNLYLIGYFYCTAYTPDLLHFEPFDIDQNVLLKDSEGDVVVSYAAIGYGSIGFSKDGSVVGFDPLRSDPAFSESAGVRHPILFSVERDVSKDCVRIRSARGSIPVQEVNIFDVTGRRIVKLVGDPGTTEYVWITGRVEQARQVPSGLYFVSVKWRDGRNETTRIAIVR